MKELGNILFVALDGLVVLGSLFLVLSGSGTVEHWMNLVFGTICFIGWLIGLCRREKQ